MYYRPFPNGLEKRYIDLNEKICYDQPKPKPNRFTKFFIHHNKADDASADLKVETLQSKFSDLRVESKAVSQLTKA